MLEDLGESSTLLTERAHAALAALAGEGGARLEAFTRSQVVYRPGRSMTVVYDCRLTDPSGAALRRALVLHAGKKPPQSATVIEGDGHRLHGWAYPHDPALPGLAMWFDAAGREKLLEGTGVSGHSTLRSRSYRPGRRAVLELRFPDRRLFVKAVPPRKVAGLQERHRLLEAVMPIPPSLGWLPEEGIVVLDGMPGEPMSAGNSYPNAAAIEALLDLIPPTEHRVPSRRDRVASHVKLLRLILPQFSDRLDRLEGALVGIDSEVPVPVHGDFHSGQVMMSEGAITGLVDVDTVGMGERSDDLANLIAHLHMAALGGKHEAARAGERLLAGFEQGGRRPSLRSRVAATVLGYAAGPWTRQSERWPEEVAARVEAAEAWLRA